MHLKKKYPACTTPHPPEWYPASAGMVSGIRRNGIRHPPEWYPASAGMVSGIRRNGTRHPPEWCPASAGMVSGIRRNDAENITINYANQ